MKKQKKFTEFPLSNPMPEIDPERELPEKGSPDEIPFTPEPLDPPDNPKTPEILPPPEPE